MKLGKFLLVGLGVVIVIGLAFFIRFNLSRIGETPGTFAHNSQSGNQQNGISNDLVEPGALAQNRKRQERIDESIGGVNQLKNQLQDIFSRNETQRSRMLAERRNTASTSYFLAVDPPTKEDVEIMRKQVARLQNAQKRDAEERQEFDEWMTTMVSDYDAFGAGGKKVIGITIHDDPKLGMYGYTYNVEDFDSELKHFNDGTIEFEKKNVVTYGRTDRGNLDRFKDLIKN